jgi:hypothetical protein
MTLPLAALYAMLWMVLMRALLVRARFLPPMCARCGLRLERRQRGERICTCSR